MNISIYLTFPIPINIIWLNSDINNNNKKKSSVKNTITVYVGIVQVGSIKSNRLTKRVNRHESVEPSINLI